MKKVLIVPCIHTLQGVFTHTCSNLQSSLRLIDKRKFNWLPKVKEVGKKEVDAVAGSSVLDQEDFKSLQNKMKYQDPNDVARKGSGAELSFQECTSGPRVEGSDHSRPKKEG
jgi:hypothetical protein